MIFLTLSSTEVCGETSYEYCIGLGDCKQVTSRREDIPHYEILNRVRKLRSIFISQYPSRKDSRKNLCFGVFNRRQMKVIRFPVGTNENSRVYRSKFVCTRSYTHRSIRWIARSLSWKQSFRSIRESNVIEFHFISIMI